MTFKSNCLLYPDRRAVANRTGNRIQSEMLYVRAAHGANQMADNLKADKTLIHIQPIIKDIRAWVIPLFIK